MPWHPRPVVLAVLGGLFLTAGATAQDEPPEVDHSLRHLYERVTEVIDDYRAASAAFDESVRSLPRAERILASFDRGPKVGEYVTRLLPLVEQHPGDQAALKGLLWAAGEQIPYDLQGCVLQILLEHHSDARELERASGRIFRTLHASEFLDALAKKTTDPAIQAAALYAHAETLKSQIQLVELNGSAENIGDMFPEENRDAFVRTFELRMGETLEWAKHADADALALQRRSLLERICEECADVSNGAWADKAAKDLEKLASLSVGLPAPEIEGTDLDGITFKLSDYRGKVVLLSFWGDW